MPFSEPDAGVIVAASNGRDVYHLWRFSGKRGEAWECECVGFRSLGKPCKHMTMAKQAVSGRKVPGVVSSWCTIP